MNESADLTKSLQMEGRFSILLPEIASYELTDGGELLEIILRPDIEPLYLQRIALSKIPPVKKVLLVSLKKHLEDFLSRGIEPVVKFKPKPSIESGEYENVIYQQLVLQVDSSTWWIARVAGAQSARSAYLLHWVGAQQDAALAVSVMTSFSITEKN